MSNPWKKIHWFQPDLNLQSLEILDLEALVCVSWAASLKIFSSGTRTWSRSGFLYTEKQIQLENIQVWDLEPEIAQDFYILKKNPPTSNGLESMNNRKVGSRGVSLSPCPERLAWKYSGLGPRNRSRSGFLHTKKNPKSSNGLESMNHRKAGSRGVSLSSCPERLAWKYSDLGPGA